MRVTHSVALKSKKKYDGKRPDNLKLKVLFLILLSPGGLVRGDFLKKEVKI